MAISGADRFQSPVGFVGNPEMNVESMTNLQTAAEYQTPTEYFSPETETELELEEELEYEGEQEQEQLNESELERELFLNELRDTDFEKMTAEMLLEVETNFESYASAHGLVGEHEHMINEQNFENVFNGYFEASIGHMVPTIQSELDSFSNYIQMNVPIGAEYDALKQVTDSYQPIHSEDFVKRFVKRVARGVKGLTKRAGGAILKAAKGVAKFGKFLISGPLRAAIRRFVGWIRANIARVLKTLVRRAITKLPPLARPVVRKALKRLGLAEAEQEGFTAESDVGSAEWIAELETEAEEELEGIQPETMIPEFQTEHIISEAEMESEEETLYENENQVAELFQEFDTELFNFAESELQQIAEAEASQPYTPEASQPYTPEASQPYTPEASQPYTPEASQPYTPEASQPYTPEASQPYTPEASQPYTPEASQPYTPEASQPYTPEASQPYTPEASQPYTPEASQPYTPEASQPYTPEASQPYTPEASQPYTPEASQPYTPEASQPYTPEASQPYTPEASQPYTPEASQPYTPEASQPYTPEASQPYTPEASQPYTPEASQPYTPEASQPYTPQSDTEMMAEQDVRMVNQAYEKFVNAVVANPSKLHQELEQFAPLVLQGVRVAFRIIPSLRRSVVNLIGRLLEKMLGRWIPKQYGSLVYRPLASLLLKLMGLEAQHDVGLQNRVFAEAIANTALESLVTAANLPQSILEGDQQILESELESIVQQSVLNNIPGEALGESFAYLRRIRGPIHFISKTGYQYLNRPIRVRLTPSQINTIRVSGGIYFSDFLRTHHMWNGRSSVTVEVLIFRTIPGRGSISNILRGYFGQGGQIRVTPFHFRQLHPMTVTSSRMLKVHNLFSRTIPTYFLVSKLLSSSGDVTTVQSFGIDRETLSPTRRSSVRSNDVSIKIDSLGRLRASVYLNDSTLKTLRAMGPHIRKGLKPTLDRIVSSGRRWITNFLARLRLPRRIARALAGLLVRIAMRYFRRTFTNIIQKINSLASRRGGVTIALVVKLPRNIIRGLVRMRPTKILFALKSIAKKVSFSVLVTPGYRI